MANSQISYGSQGNDVLELQKKLNQNGYSLEEDGIYGSATQSAVRDYQTKNSLTVDGIAGSQTWEALNKTQTGTTQTGSSGSQAGTAVQQTTSAAPDYSGYQYDASNDAAYQQALAALQEARKQAPAYKGTYDQQLDELYQQIMGREDFSYNMNEDAFWQQAVDQYTRQGRMAMMDTMGQAAALTGGYGNSYAQNVGQQAYQDYLLKLSELAPEYYQMALERYSQEGEALQDKYALTGDLADREYGKYQDDVSQYWQNLSYLQGEADDAYSRGAENWYNAYQLGSQAQSTNYDRLVTMMTSLGYQPTDEELLAAGMSAEQAQAYMDYYAKQNQSSGGGGYYRASDDSDGEEPGGLSYEDILNDAMAGASGGAKRKDIFDHLADAESEGVINRTELQQIMSKVTEAIKKR